MVYDRDLKWMLRANWAVLVLNGGGAIESALRHSWFVAGAYLVWVRKYLHVAGNDEEFATRTR